MTLPTKFHKILLAIIVGACSLVLFGTLNSQAASALAVSGDLNNDGIVDIYDPSLLINNYGKSGARLTGDLDANGTVDSTDFNILKSNFRKTNTSNVATCAVTTPNIPDGPDPWGGCFPGPKTTGVPAGTTLTNYSGPCVITTDNTIIDAKTINCNPLEIQAKNVLVKRSLLNGQLYLNSDDPRTQYNMTFSVTLQDSEVNVGMLPEPAVFEGAMTIIRSNIHGGITSVQCGDKAAQCIIEDSYLHGQLIQPQTTWHLGGFHSIGGANYGLTHNSVFCDQTYTYETASDSGGCSGDIVFIPYGVPISHADVEKNLLGASTSLSYCMYSGDDPNYNFSYMTFKDNVFQRGSNGKCGDFGPVAGYTQRTTATWSNNLWDDGAVVPPDY